MKYCCFCIIFFTGDNNKWPGSISWKSRGRPCCWWEGPGGERAAALSAGNTFLETVLNLQISRPIHPCPRFHHSQYVLFLCRWGHSRIIQLFFFSLSSLASRGGTIPIPKNCNSGSVGYFKGIELESKESLMELKRSHFLIHNSSFNEQAEEIAIHNS